MPSLKILQTKQKIVADLVEKFKDAKTFVFVDARGLTVLEDTQLRADLRKNNVVYQVIKNSLLRLVFKELNIEGLEEVLKNPTAVAFSNEDIILPAKIIKQNAEKMKNLEIKAGVLEGKAISAKEVDALASIPSKEVLYGQVVYTLMAPIVKLAMVSKAIAEKKEASEGSPVVVETTEATSETTSEVAEEVEVASPSVEAAVVQE